MSIQISIPSHSDLVKLMLDEGLSYVLCRMTDDMRPYGTHVRPIVSYDKDLFKDAEGSNWRSVTPIHSNGSVMSYDDYIKIKRIYQEEPTDRFAMETPDVAHAGENKEGEL